MAYCIKCGKPNPESAKFCTSCGATLTVQVTSQAHDQVNSRTKNWSPWIVIAIVAIAALGVGAYFTFFNKKSGKQTAQTESTQKIPGSYPYASQRILIDDDVKNLSQYTLRIMRNEIYARHGYIFQNREMNNYFSSQPWYIPQSGNVTSMLSVIEKTNILLIKRYETFVEDYGKDFSR